MYIKSNSIVLIIPFPLTLGCIIFRMFTLTLTLTHWRYTLFQDSRFRFHPITLLHTKFQGAMGKLPAK